MDGWISICNGHSEGSSIEYSRITPEAIEVFGVPEILH